MVAVRRLMPLAAALSLAGCGGPMSTLDPEGATAQALAGLSWFVLLTFCVVALAMAALLLWPVLRRRRGSLDEHAPIGIDGGMPWIWIGGFAIPFVVLAVVFVYGLKVMAAHPLHDGEVPTPEIVVTGHQWWWQVDYVSGPAPLHFKTANEIHIPVGKLVDIQVQTADVIHSFWIPKLNGKVDLIPGKQNRIRLRADHAGVFQGQCAEFCGAQHAHMRIVVVAEPQAEYEAWLARQRQPAAAPSTALAAQGRDVFMRKPCALCHAIRGTPARAGVGPDLTHLASRRGLAANSLPNNRANLEAWITHAQSLKPEVMMPNVTQMDGRELRALTSYLEGLQ